jgi:transaldolase
MKLQGKEVQKRVHLSYGARDATTNPSMILKELRDRVASHQKSSCEAACIIHLSVADLTTAMETRKLIKEMDFFDGTRVWIVPA